MKTKTNVDGASRTSNSSTLTYKILAHVILYAEPEQELQRLISNEKVLACGL